jgi:hypothetical protein
MPPTARLVAGDFAVELRHRSADVLLIFHQSIRGLL